MSRTFHHGERRIRVKAIRRNPPDARGMARALIGLALAQIEADAQAELEALKKKEGAKETKPRRSTKVDPDKS
jgi:hypothetical protein